MSKEKEYKKRLEFISEDIKLITKNSSEAFLFSPVTGYENIGTLISNIEIASDLSDDESLQWKTKFDIPTHDPQTGELNPYYEELTGKKNPLTEGKKEYLHDIKEYIKKNPITNDKDLDKMPNQKWHQIVSFIKSGIRIVGYVLIPFDLIIAASVLVLSEVVGVVEELV